MRGKSHIFADHEALAVGVAEWIVAVAIEAIQERGRFTLALAGGSTPRPVYTQLVQPQRAARIDWTRVQLFWGDERCVPPDHAESNYGMARAALLDAVPLPAENVHRMRGELPPEEAARAYAATLRAIFGDVAWPRFDLILLGLGEDGHTASLFPHTAVLQETERWVVAQHVSALDAWRLTLTPPVLNAAAQVAFVVAGRAKVKALHRVLNGPYRPEAYPAQYIHPTAGTLHWFLDREAAVALEIA